MSPQVDHSTSIVNIDTTINMNDIRNDGDSAVPSNKPLNAQQLVFEYISMRSPDFRKLTALRQDVSNSYCLYCLSRANYNFNLGLEQSRRGYIFPSPA